MNLKKHLVAGLWLASALVGFGQNTGSISGVITDESGAVVVGAAVTATNSQTGIAVRATSLSGGKLSSGSGGRCGFALSHLFTSSIAFAALSTSSDAGLSPRLFGI